MRRRQFAALVLAGGVSSFLRRALAATNQAAGESIEGRLVQHGDGPSTLEAPGGRSIALEGEDESQKVLHDPRIGGMDLEALGHFTSANQFTLGPFYDKNMFVKKGGRRLRITYWCDVCAIRTYTPGPCVCCQKWTDLDLRDPNQE